MIYSPSFGWFTDFCTVSLPLTRPTPMGRPGERERKPENTENLENPFIDCSKCLGQFFRIFLLLNLWICRVGLTFSLLGFILRSSQRGHGRPRSCSAVLALPRQHHLSFLLFALEHFFLPCGSQRQHSVLVSGSERRGAAALRRKSAISCLPQTAWSRLHHSTTFSAPSAKICLYWRLQDELLILKRLSHLLRFAWLFFLPASVQALCIIYHQHRGFDVICCCVTFNNCKIKM